MRTGRKGMIKEMKRLGSVEPLAWIKECIDLERDWILDKKWDITHIRFKDIDTFRESVEKYAEEHPDAKVMATGFVFSSEKPFKKYKYKED